MNRRDLLKAFATAPALAAVKSVEILRPQPDDTIVITASFTLSEFDRAYIIDVAKEAFRHNRIVVLDSDMGIKIVRKE